MPRLPDTPPRELPHPLPPELVDGMHDALDRVAAVADLLTLVAPPFGPDRLQLRTIPRAGALILGEAGRMRALLAAHDPSFGPEKPSS